MSRVDLFLALGAPAFFGDQLRHVRPHHRQLLDILKHWLLILEWTVTMRTVLQGHLHMFIDVVGFGSISSDMTGLAPGRSRVGIAFLLTATEGSGLPVGLPLPEFELLADLLKGRLALLQLGILLLELLAQL